MPLAESISDVMLERFVKWAAGRGDLRAAVVIGSRAATNAVPDQWSDTDIVLVATNPRRLLDDPQWLSSLGTPLLSCVASIEGETFRAAWFDGDVKFDFIIISRNQARAASALLRLVSRLPASRVLLPHGIRRQLDTFSQTIGKGIHVLFDKDGSAAALALVHVRRPAPRMPTQAEFQNAVRTFLSWSLWTAKILSRGELWRSKHSCDHEMKEMLLQMLEWHAHAQRGTHADTWYLGRYLEKWADPRAVDALRECFAHYDDTDVWRALLATVRTHSWVARETAERLGFAYPFEEERWVVERVEKHELARRNLASCE